MAPVHRVCLIDALGTMVLLEPPWENIDGTAVAGIGAERVREAFIAEMAYYVAHSGEGTDAESLADLRRRCAAVLSEGLGRRIDVATMMDAIRFRVFEDVAPALAELRGLGLQVVCVSNWDVSLHEVLEGLDLAPALDGVVTSAEVGARKPDPAIFERALALAGCAPAEALHVGDSDDDVAGARAAGIDVLRIDRSGGGEISSLLEIGQHLLK